MCADVIEEDPDWFVTKAWHQDFDLDYDDDNDDDDDDDDDEFITCCNGYEKLQVQ